MEVLEYYIFCPSKSLLPINVSMKSEILLLENEGPSCSDEVPGQRHPHNILGNVTNGRGGVLLADLSWVECVLQIPGSTKTFSYEEIISKTLFQYTYFRRKNSWGSWHILNIWTRFLPCLPYHVRVTNYPKIVKSVGFFKGDVSAESLRGKFYTLSWNCY